MSAEPKTLDTPIHEVEEQSVRLWHFGLGALVEAGQRGESLFRTLVARGELVETKGLEHLVAARDAIGRRVDGVRGEVDAGLTRLGEPFDGALSGILRRVGVPTREEIETLDRRLDELAGSLEALAAEPEAPSSKPAAKSAAKSADKASAEKAPAKKKASSSSAKKSEPSKGASSKSSGKASKPAKGEKASKSRKSTTRGAKTASARKPSSTSRAKSTRKSGGASTKTSSKES